MASIGGTSCTFVKGTLPAQREESEVWRVPGINGYGIALMGLGDSRTELTAVIFDTAANVNSWTATLQLLQGAIGEITNDHGDSYALCYFNRVGNLKKDTIRIPGSATNCRGEVQIEAILL
jgi:hypothetical protein